MIFTNEEQEFLDKHKDILDLGLGSKKVRAFLGRSDHADLPLSSPYLIRKIAFYLIYMAHPKDWIILVEDTSPTIYNEDRVLRFSLLPPKEVDLGTLGGNSNKSRWFRNCLKEFPGDHIPTRDEAIGILEREYPDPSGLSFEISVWYDILRKCTLDVSNVQIDPNLQRAVTGNIGIAPGVVSGIIQSQMAQAININPYSATSAYMDIDSYATVSRTDSLQSEIQDLRNQLDYEKRKNDELEAWRSYIDSRMRDMDSMVDQWARPDGQ